MTRTFLSVPPAQAAKRILILGGTGFIGPHMVRYAVARGHTVSIFTRGRSQVELPDEVERLVGDRNDNLSALDNRTWDVVIDNNASRYYQWVQLSTEKLKDAAEQYIFVSSISAYAGDLTGDDPTRVLYQATVDEDHERFELPDGWQDGDEAHYGLMKTIGENLAHEAFPGRATVVRPGLIVGPGDPTDRFTYWPVRIDDGGEILAPGDPAHATQVIDQRDLTEWIVRLAEDGTPGNFNGTGPATRMSMSEMLYGIKAATATVSSFTWVPESFLEAQGVRAWQDLPAWMPGAPLMFVNVERAVAAGLTFRPMAVTARDTIAWNRGRPADRRPTGFGMSREREAETLAAWRAAQG